MTDSKRKGSKSRNKKAKKLENRKFTKEQIESIRNSPMMVKKRKAAEKAFASPSYKELSKSWLKKRAKKKSKGA